ncbi:hypothetical protein [Lactobacillus sp. LL6]|uniref:hypothetical protein n=1 Tax=Lactobacillus sp. LL6 TaxID=2596827 RepID=UPI001186ED5F|nr:hypothetical protein [Lactobacillus sp. LL6]TSO26698.1 hypothetical protein FOD82_06450 [Lactobacillus sp. LL6]
MWSKVIKHQFLYISKNYKINLVNISLGIIIALASVGNLARETTQGTFIYEVFSEYLFCFGLYPMIIFNTLFKFKIRLSDIYATRSRNILLQQMIIQLLETLISLLVPWLVTIWISCKIKSLRPSIFKIDFLLPFIYLILSCILVMLMTLIFYWAFFNKIIAFLLSFVIVAIMFYCYRSWHNGVLYSFMIAITDWKVISEIIGIDILLFALLEVLVTQREIL